MFIVFIGPPGSGKGTQSNRLVEYLGVAHLSTGDMLRFAVQEGSELGKEAKGYMDNGALVPDELVVDIVGLRMSQPDCANGCLLDGFPRTLNQAVALDEYLRENEKALDVVLELKADEAEVISRLVGRATTENRADDDSETVTKRLKVFHQQAAIVTDYYKEQGLLEIIDGMGSPDEVFVRIKRVVDSLGND